MKLLSIWRRTALTGSCLVGTIASTNVAHAGGLQLPGYGAVSTGRAGAAVASTDDHEALAINPAGLAHVKGTHVGLGFIMATHSQSFQRNGSYDDIDGQSLPWEGQRYPVITDQAKPPTGFGGVQPLPTVAVVSDFGGKLGGLTAAIGLFVPTAYPSRNMAGNYVIDDPAVPPPASRYDIVEQNAAVYQPSVALAYSILPNLRVGARFSAGIAQLESRLFLWGIQNNEEWVGHDVDFRLKARDNFVPSWSAGVQYAPLPQLEIAAQFTSAQSINAKGDSISTPSKDLNLSGIKIEIGAPPDAQTRCGTGGTNAVQRGCVEMELPMNAALAGRYKFYDQAGHMRGDIEANVFWENWSSERATDYRVIVDGVVNNTIDIKDALVRHGLRDTWSVRLGGSYNLQAAGNRLTLRGGAAYDTGAAKPGWERADLDGAARTMLTAGASYELPRVRFDIGGGAALQGTRNVGGDCNPTLTMPGCSGSGRDVAYDERGGWDPVNPVIVPRSQVENPVNHGTYKSHYVMFMLGASTKF